MNTEERFELLTLLVDMHAKAKVVWLLSIELLSRLSNTSCKLCT